MVDDAKKIEITAAERKQSDERALADALETRLIADKKIDLETKTICTQTSTEVVYAKEITVQDNTVNNNVNYRTPSHVYLDRKKSSTFRNVDDDLAPQWLIEEALNRGTERSERRTKENISSNNEYERIISDLESKLAKTQDNLEDALRSKSAAKEKYRRSLEYAKTEARRANEVLQERIVRICTSVLENFGPRSTQQWKSTSYQIKCRRKLKCHEKISIKLHRKLRIAVTKSNKLKRELKEARRTLKAKSQEYQSISKCFNQVKREMDSTETNLNNLIAENLSLRKKMDETRVWLKNNMGREHHNAGHFRDLQKNRELSNLKKKVEEDWTTISQLRNKVVRLESANANKGFLLNSYKSQVADLNKEKDQLVSKMNSLENDICNVRRSNSQLKAKVSLMSVEKDKLLSDNEKSKTDVTEKIQTQYSKKYDETAQQEIEAVKAKYEETIKLMKMKLMAIKNQNVEYSKAIKDLVKKLYEYQGDRETPKPSNESEESEREAHETACNILNMTPEELSGLINEGRRNSVNPWMVELNQIISTKHFSEDLSKFLLKKATKRAT